jgi:DNA-binding NtrC family response regulator
LQKISNNSFDLVLADIKMPGMDGLELLQIIKKDYPQLTVVMMTAFAQIDMAVKAMRSGAYDFITKPFEHDALVLRWKRPLSAAGCCWKIGGLQNSCRDNYIFEQMVGKARPCNGSSKPSRWWPKPTTPC